MTTTMTTTEEKPDPKMFIGIFEVAHPEDSSKNVQNIFCARHETSEQAQKKYEEFIASIHGCKGGPLLEIPLAFHRAVETVLMTAMGVPPIGYQEEFAKDSEPLFVMIFEKTNGGFHAMPLVNNADWENGMGAFVRDHEPETGGEALEALAKVLDRKHCGIGWRQR